MRVKGKGQGARVERATRHRVRLLSTLALPSLIDLQLCDGANHSYSHYYYATAALLAVPLSHFPFIPLALFALPFQLDSSHPNSSSSLRFTLYHHTIHSTQLLSLVHLQLSLPLRLQHRQPPRSTHSHTHSSLDNYRNLLGSSLWCCHKPVLNH